MLNRRLTESEIDNYMWDFDFRWLPFLNHIVFPVFKDTREQIDILGNDGSICVGFGKTKKDAMINLCEWFEKRNYD